jgi:hypothetical protein
VSTHSRPSISIVNWFLKNAMGKEITNLEVLNPMLKLLLSREIINRVSNSLLGK